MQNLVREVAVAFAIVFGGTLLLFLLPWASISTRSSRGRITGLRWPARCSATLPSSRPSSACLWSSAGSPQACNQHLPTWAGRGPQPFGTADRSLSPSLGWFPAPRHQLRFAVGRRLAVLLLVPAVYPTELTCLAVKSEP